MDILIINLKKYGSIYQSSHLVESIIKKNPLAKISYLVFDEFKEATQLIFNVHKIYTIPQKKITSFYKNSIYSTGLAINELERALRPITENSWNNIINFSNDKLSTHLTSYITKSTNASFSGVRFSSKQTIEYNNSWVNIYNHISSSFSPSPIATLDTFNIQLKTQFNLKGNKIKTSPQHDSNVIQNFDKLRYQHRDVSDNLGKIIGIQIHSPHKLENTPHYTITQLLDIYMSTPGLIPIILTSPNDQERMIVSKIKKKLNKKIISIETDLFALPSVIKNIDLVITSRSDLKHLCDTLNTPYLEINYNPHLLFKQGICNFKSKTLSYCSSLEDLFNNPNKDIEYSKILNSLEFNDIYYASLSILNNFNVDSIFKKTTSWSLYSSQRDALGTFLINEAGFININIELKRLLNRQILSSFFQKEDLPEIFEYLLSTFKEDCLKLWISEEKKHLTMLSKDILATLRFLIQAQGNINKGKSFIDNLEKIFTYLKDKNLTTLPILIFQSQIEVVDHQLIEDNLKEVERLIYQLKNYIQESLQNLKKLELLIEQKKKDNMTNRFQNTHHAR